MVTITVHKGLNIAEKRRPRREMHHAWRKQLRPDPIIHCSEKYFDCKQLDQLLAEQRQRTSSNFERKIHALGSCSKKNDTTADCKVEKKHIQADEDRLSGQVAEMGTCLKIVNGHQPSKCQIMEEKFKSKNTCKISQRDQQQVPAKRNRQPSNQFWPPEPKADFAGRNSVLSSFGPFSKVMELAPPAQKTVPAILAMLLKLRIFIFSNLINLEIRKTC